MDCDPDSNPDSGPGARVNAAKNKGHLETSHFVPCKKVIILCRLKMYTLDLGKCPFLLLNL